ncbi:multisubstrate pseudouridine synthase 7 isoform X2 [Syzygium oleosum]|uniref:multisubstrate pseudouridine synthase 7 isoform X2 n=1 Tax=Syzygium oleosum TaxID=219896 RepID=UPI0024B9EEEC|nr:multisubstrate pseudouridine synthase 7 isoform X2 [Syzygium oleosum]
MAMKTPEESDVGIVCYISNLPGFRGILKQRYSDFIVNEVDLEGNVVRLTTLDAPPEPVHIAEGNETNASDHLNKSYDAEIESFRTLAGEPDADLLQGFIARITSGAEESLSPTVLSPNSDKIHRTAIHNYFKEKFKFLVTDTIDGPDASTKCIRVRVSSGGQSKGKMSKKRKERGDKPFDSRGSSSWPEHVGKFLRFHLFKENKDTQEALGLIGKMLGTQVTVFKQSASKLASLNEKLIGIKVGDFCYVKDGLVLGKLLGNRFTVTLRGVIADSEDTIKAAADALGKQGFINYFGLQRFGSGSVPTHNIGAALLRGEWKTAVSMILDPREGEKDVVAIAREYYKESGDIDGTLRRMPRHLVAERAVLQSLKKFPGNYLQALKAIPRTLRMMYVHSYQSYLWNHAASARAQKCGSDQVVVGDIVHHEGHDDENVAEVVSECGNDDSSDAFDHVHLDETSEMDLRAEGHPLVKALTSEDIASGRYSLDDIVLPLPGSRVIYPNNDVADIYHDLAKKDSISLTESVHNVKEFSITSMTGGYRRVFQKPMDYEWEMLRYRDFSVPLAETDLDKITKSKHLRFVEGKDFVNGNDNPLDSVISSTCENGANASVNIGEASISDRDEIHMALKLAFSLPSSSYATMAIRELLKTSTSVAFHKTLNHETCSSSQT